MKTPDLITDVVAPLGPNARAMLEKCPDCGHARTIHRVSSVTGEVTCWHDAWTQINCDCHRAFVSTAETEHEALVAKIVAVGAFVPMAKQIAAMLIREYKMVPNETDVPDER